MGAHFTTLLKSSGETFTRISRLLQSLSIVRWMQKLNLPWPPRAQTVQRYAPYLLICVYLPKLAWDVYTLLKKVPVNDELQAESDAELQVALAKGLELLRAFVKADIRLPAGSSSEKVQSEVRRCAALLLDRYAPDVGGSQHDSGKEGDGLPVVPGALMLSDGDIDSTLDDASNEENADDDNDNNNDDNADEDDEAGGNEASVDSLFSFDGRLKAALAEGDWTDEFDELDEKLTAMEANVEVIHQKLDTPPVSHKLHVQSEEVDMALAMILHWSGHLRNELVCNKTQLGATKKWAEGKLLAELHEQAYNHVYWYGAIPPKAYTRLTGRRATREHKTQARRSMGVKSFALFDPLVQTVSCRMLQLVEEDQEKRLRLLSKIRKSKLSKMVHAVRLIVGSWTNWAMVGAGWLGDFAEGMVSGALMFYRSELLITAQSVATAAVSGSDSSSMKLPYSELMSVVSAIIISELAKILVHDIKGKMDDMGENAIRKRLEYMLGERLLAQDLETYDENKKAQERSYTWGLTPQHLLRAFPLEKFFNLPRNFLRVASTTGTTAYLLWSKNPFLSLVVLGALLAKRFILDRSREVKNFIWWSYFSSNAPSSSSRRGSVSIFQALHNFYDVRVNGNELYHLKELHRKDEVERISEDRSDAFNAMYQSITSFVREMPTITTYVVGCGLIVKRTLAPSDLVMFPTSIQDMLDEWEDLLEEYSCIYDFEDNEIKQLDAIVELLNEKPSIGIRGGFTPESGELEDSSIEFRDVAFRRSSWPIRQAGLTFKVPAGSFVALCGKNGVGKSTLFKLLLRLYDVDEGEVLVGGRNIKDYNPVWLRSRAVSMAPQKPGMYRGTLRTNFIYGSEEKWIDKKATDDEIDAAIEKVLARAGTLEMFKDPRLFAQGFDTYKDPSQMSGGQQRAIGLARALFRDTKILLLDEPTNDLDPDRQQAVKTSLIEQRPAGQTILCITHELSTIRDADMILFFNKDQESGITTITGAGTYDELLQSCDTFKRWHEFKWPGDAHESLSEASSTAAGSSALDDSALSSLRDSARGDIDSLPSPYTLQRSMTWSRGHSHDSNGSEEPESPASSRRTRLQRENEKFRLKQMHRQLQDQLRGFDQSGARGAVVGSEFEEKSSPDDDRQWLLFRSTGEFRGAQARLDKMQGRDVSRLLPQYEMLLQQMRLRVREWERESHRRPFSRLFPRASARGKNHNLLVHHKAKGSLTPPPSMTLPRTPLPKPIVDDERDDLPAELLSGPLSMRRSATHVPHSRHSRYQ